MATRLVVIGDALLDRDLDGTVERLSPDAPVPVVDDPAATSRPGGAALAAVLAARADGARMWTRYVAAAKSDAHPRYVDALIAAGPAETAHGRAFVYGWDAPGRVLRSCVAAAEAFAGEVVGEVPSLDGTREPLHRFEPDAITRGVTGAIEAMPLWAGESVVGVTRVRPAAEIVREVADEAERLLGRWGSREPAATGAGTAADGTR